MNTFLKATLITIGLIIVLVGCSVPIADDAKQVSHDPEEKTHEDSIKEEDGKVVITQNDKDSVDVGESVDSFMHVHGLSYDPQEPYDLYLSTHHGLIRIDDEGQWNWTSSAEHRHDLMSFTFRDEETMIASGHPAKASDFQDPLGVIISKDRGKTWEPIALHGEVDFHVMEVNASDPDVIYGIDAHGSGLYRSTDGGFNWEVLETKGLPEDFATVFALVSDPGNPESVLAGTQRGIFKSEDGGKTWELKSNEQTFVSGKGVSKQSGMIIVYLYGQSPGLMISHDFGETWDSLNLVLEGNDAVTHIAVHPSEEGVYTVGTREEHLFQTADGGENWIQIAENGKPLR
ncbi:hypothetical protein CathTA2_0274 [Caldalkalibacillus thermarum TA2.A1]|uniref:Sortilin N-terminal domain-containing protein n=1 Tax=Caldalkalibacillus thermarum (strain TA2.A1) TaxID=986075 RepID=F5L3B3_CALTT|nr:hypothetical protein [Caldalkalibacillus thermarum]EGL84175.1 hypothetical protein CathTA2_0274 [Caldalkalibacillus thermarum TA2.A1]